MFLASINFNDSTFGVFLPTGNLKKLRNLLPFPYDYHIWFDLGKGICNFNALHRFGANVQGEFRKKLSGSQKPKGLI